MEENLVEQLEVVLVLSINNDICFDFTRESKIGLLIV